MYITVKLLNGFSKPLTYKIPQSFDGRDLRNAVVQVPLQKRTEYGLVIDQSEIVGYVPYNIRELSDIPPFVADTQYHSFIEYVARYYSIANTTILNRLHTILVNADTDVVVQEDEVVSQIANTVTLTQEQESAAQKISTTINANNFAPHLLYGLTGSGKTEVYKQIINNSIAQQKSVIFMLPEVGLARQFEKIFRLNLPGTTRIFSFHSATIKKERKELWNALLQQQPCVIIGVHLPILLPITNLGIIIIDEEHETGYQEKKFPHLDTKQIALMRAMQYKLPIVLGSATPSVATLYNAQQRGWPMHRLTQRFGGTLPTVDVVILSEKKSKTFWISDTLRDAIQTRLDRKEQTIIFLNRRGYSKFVQCTACGDIAMCKHCSVSLTLHENNRLICHYCGYWQQLHTACSACKSTQLLHKGIGTQQLVTILQKMFPTARITRADQDTTGTKKWQANVEKIHAGEIDIIVGTQTITKGFHFPRVTLVGIIWADSNVNLPVYTSQETTLQQLLQVAGRAGRSSNNGQVIVQAVRYHTIFECLDETKYEQFYEMEMHMRTLLQYPPVVRMASIELSHHDEATVQRDSKIMAMLLKQESKLIILGPCLPPVAQIANLHRRRIYCKATTMDIIAHALTHITKSEHFESLISWIPNPLN